MTHALVVVDRRFLRINGIWYTQGPAGPETGEKYLPYFDQITVAGRQGNADGEDLSRLSRLDPRIHVVTLPNLSGITAQITRRGATRQALRALIADVDAVIVRVPTELGFVAVELAEKQGLPLATDVGACAYDGMRAYGGLVGKFYAPLRAHRARQAVQRSSFVHYVTQRYLQDRYPPAPKAQTLAVSDVTIAMAQPQTLATRLDRIEARAANPEKRLVFGTVGSLVGKLKGLHVAIEALGRLQTQLPPFEYRILGGGNPTPLKALADRHGLGDLVYFDGTRPAGEQVLQWLDGVDVYLQPSLREGLSRATIEAMSRACPAIVSDIAGMYELIDDAERVPPGDVSALMRAIRRAVAPDWQLTHAKRNWNRARDYASETLDPKRDCFWLSFAQAARQHTKNGLNGP
jgi:glycosyltransferase involved in cell wall biosynthesis